MIEGYACDEDLLRRLPLPLAQLYRRAHNAKAALERHLTALYLWEASLKLLASIAVVSYADRPEHDAQLAERLQALARPSVGHWWEFVRLLVPALADAGDSGFGAVRELLLGRTRDDLPRCAGLDALLREELEGKPGARATVRLAELFDRLVTYRNKGVAHAAPGQRPGAFHERMAGALLAGLGELLGRLDVLAGRRLLYIAEVRQVGGIWLVRRYELVGESARGFPSLELPREEAARLPDGERVYLLAPLIPPATAVGGEGEGGLHSLHPLLLYDAEVNEALFLNTRRGRRRTEYLCYTSGRTIDRPDLGSGQRALLARVLGTDVAEEHAEAWAARVSAAEPAGEPEPPPASRRLLGEFELLSELGRGGMGVVYRAWQPSLGRQVALKCLFQTGDPKAEARFRREIRALGKVEHPGVVKVFTSGSEGDQWFYAMELVEGATLAAVCDRLQTRVGSVTEVDLPAWQETLSAARAAARQAEKPPGGPPPSRERERPEPPPGADAPGSPGKTAGRGYVRHVVELVRHVALAAHALHEAGVVHRDINPGNIMLSADGRAAFLMDLGLAQLADDIEGRVTRTRQFVGTLRYASPEQVLAVGGLDRRSDVYGLGATLWELLALRPLYGATDETPDAELMRRIQLEEPERLRQRHPGLARDLEAVVHKCLEKDPGRRYATAAELAEDLRRFLDGKPVRARRVGRAERSLKWVRRHPWQAGLLGACALALFMLGVGGVGWYYSTRLRAALAEANRQKDRADGLLYFVNIERAHALWRSNDVKRADDILEACTAEQRLNWEWRYLHRLCHSELLTLHERRGRVTAVAWSPDGTRLASASETAKVWDAKTGQQALSLDCGGAVSSVAFSPDGSRLAYGNVFTVKVWDIKTGQVSLTLHPGEAGLINGVGWSPDGKRLATALGRFDADASFDPRCNGPFGAVKIWDAQTGREVLSLKGHTDAVLGLSWSPDGTRLASASSDRMVKVWDTQSGQEVLTLRGHTSWVLGVAWSPDGGRLASASTNPLDDERGEVKVWDARTGGEALALLGHTDFVQGVCWSADGSRLATGSWDRTVKVWDARTGEEALTLRGHTGPVNGVGFSPDGGRLASAARDGTVKVWDAKAPQEALPWHGHTEVTEPVRSDLAWSADGARLAGACGNGVVKVWDAQTGQEALTLRQDALGIALSPDGKRLASASGGRDPQKQQAFGDVKVWDVQTAQQTLSLKAHTDYVNRVAFSPEGTRLASASSDGTVKVWDAKSGQEVLALKGYKSSVRAVAWDPGGARLASACGNGVVQVWDAQTGQAALTLWGHMDTVNDVSWSPDGARLASASTDGMVRIFDAQTGQEVLSFKGHGGDVLGVAFSPDGRRLATAFQDGTVSVWDWRTGQEALTLKGHSHSVCRVAWSPDGKRLASASDDGTVNLWPGRPLALPGEETQPALKPAQP
jgi:WD40 repeat protein/serine/threonine protein kinase